MIDYHCAKLWGGRVSVRDCVVKYAKKTGQAIQVEYDGQVMKINSTTPYTCDMRHHIAQMTDKYIKQGQTYLLFDYTWTPVVESENEWTDEGKSKMFEAMKKLFGKR